MDEGEGAAGAPRLRLFLAGDVMLGRGIDQILPHPGDPRLHEGWMTSALDYVDLAERNCGPIPRPVSPAHVWGDLLGDLDRLGCDLRLANLETAITTAGVPEPKGINYRMHPQNVPVLAAARIDACILANNHAMDWGRDGLVETLDTLRAAGIGCVGAGRTGPEAAAPLVLEAPGKGRLLVMAFGGQDSGVPAHWAAGPDRPGVQLLPDSAEAAVATVKAQLAPLRRPGDLVLVSIHWGGNWGYGRTDRHRRLAHALVDRAGVNIVFGHSSHHPKGIELHRGQVVFYGAGDLINDYEGIGGHEGFRGDLGLGYVLDLDPAAGRLAGLRMLAVRRRGFRLNRADAEENAWLATALAADSLPEGLRIVVERPGMLRLAP